MWCGSVQLTLLGCWCVYLTSCFGIWSMSCSGPKHTRDAKPARALSISQRVQSMHEAEVQDQRLMDIYGSPIRARTPGSSVGFNKRNASTIFSGPSQDCASTRSNTGSPYGNGRPTSSWRPEVTADMSAPRAAPIAGQPRHRTQPSTLPFSSGRVGGSTRGGSRNDGYPW
jgi:hypothetical protein